MSRRVVGRFVDYSNVKTLGKKECEKKGFKYYNQKDFQGCFQKIPNIIIVDEKTDKITIATTLKPGLSFEIKKIKSKVSKLPSRVKAVIATSPLKNFIEVGYVLLSVNGEKELNKDKIYKNVGNNKFNVYVFKKPSFKNKEDLIETKKTIDKKIKSEYADNLGVKQFRTYTEEIKQIEKGVSKKGKEFFKKKRGSKIPEEYENSFEQVQSSRKPGVEKCTVGNAISMIDVKKEFKRIQKLFPNSIVKNINTRYVDQGEDGRCTFAGVLTLLSVLNEMKLVKRFDPKKPYEYMGYMDIIKESTNMKEYIAGWENDYKSFGSEPQYTSTMLDLAKENKIFKKEFFDRLRYIPVFEGRFYNNQFWNKKKTLQWNFLRGKILKEKLYDAIPFYFENERLLKDLIDNRIPVAIGAMGHNRTAIGYNDTHVLFFDSWSRKHEQAFPEDHYKGGFSIVSNRKIFNNIREFTYLLK